MFKFSTSWFIKLLYGYWNIIKTVIDDVLQQYNQDEYTHNIERTLLTPIFRLTFLIGYVTWYLGLFRIDDEDEYEDKNDELNCWHPTVQKMKWNYKIKKDTK